MIILIGKCHRHALYKNNGRACQRCDNLENYVLFQYVNGTWALKFFWPMMITLESTSTSRPLSRFSEDHVSLYVGDARGRIFCWSPNDSTGKQADHWVLDSGSKVRSLAFSVNFTSTGNFRYYQYLLVRSIS